MIFSPIEKDDFQKIARKLRNGDLKFYQFYNIDFSADEYAFQEYMQNFKETADSTSVLLNKTYYDIEVLFDPAVFPDSEQANYMINSVAVYNNLQNKAVIFTCPYYTDLQDKQYKQCNITDKDTLQKGVQDLYIDLTQKNHSYLIKDLQIEVRVYKTEEELIKNLFLHFRKLNTLFLIGFNSFIFDDPYIVNRALNLFGKNCFQYISEFGEVEKFGNRSYEWADYTKVDLLQLYKPVDQGGNGLGRSLPNYKLDTVAEEELSINKLDLEDLNESYKQDIVSFITYNLLDTLLTFKLDEKLQFLELNWMLAKYNNAPVSSAIRGRSLMYRYRNDLFYTKNNQIIRNKTYSREIFYPLIL